MSHPAPDVYFTEGYGRAAALAERAEWQLVSLADGAFQMPLLVRELPSGRKDAASPYGYSGAWVDPSLDEARVAELWREAVAEMASRGIVSVFVRTSPLVNQAPAPDGAIWVVRGHDTFYVACRGEQENWDAFQGRARTSVRKAEKNGFSCTIAPCTADDLAADGDFRALYEATMGKVSATDFYLFDDAYYAALLEGLGENLLLGMVRDEQGAPMAAALFMRGPEHLHYHLSGSSPEGLRFGGTTMVLHEAIRLANREGLVGLELGGGVRSGDGLEKFKASFGGEVRVFTAYGLVVDADGYDAELTARAAELGVEADALRTPGFFPAYRRTADHLPTDEADDEAGEGASETQEEQR